MSNKPPEPATGQPLPRLPGQADRLLRHLEWHVIRRLDGLNM